MKMNVFSVLVVAGLLFLTACGGKGTAKEPTIKLITIFDGTTVDLCEPEVRAYLNAETEADQVKTIREMENVSYQHQTVLFAWESDGSSEFTVYIADNPKFENAYEFKTAKTELKKEAGILVPGTTYYWKVVGDKEGSTSKVDSLKTLDAPGRFITTEGIPNVRDIGGWKTADGKKVKYGLVYRGGKTNNTGVNSCSPYDNKLFSETLGVETEIDLRTQDADDGGQSKSVFDDVFYYKTTLTQYSYIFPDFEQEEPMPRSYDKRSKYSIREIFKVLADEENYPIMFHCNAGADRTGTVAFLINGVLGVSYEDLTRDFELTAGRNRSAIVDGLFDEGGVMQDNADNYIAWDKMYQTMMAEYGTEDGSLASAIENYLVTVCKVKEKEIESLKSIMLE